MAALSIATSSSAAKQTNPVHTLTVDDIAFNITSQQSAYTINSNRGGHNNSSSNDAITDAVAASINGALTTATASSADAVDLLLHPSGLVPVIQNIVCTANLNTKINLKFLAMHARNAEYNPKRFTAVIIRIREPKATALVFASGKLVVTGSRSEVQCKLAARKFARIIQQLQLRYIGQSAIQFTQWHIENMVASVDIRSSIRLEGLSHEHDDYSSFEPELFPGLIYRMVEPKVVLLIFVSGKVVITGAKSREQIYQAFENIYPVLQDFTQQQQQLQQQPELQHQQQQLHHSGSNNDMNDEENQHLQHLHNNEFDDATMA